MIFTVIGATPISELGSSAIAAARVWICTLSTPITFAKSPFPSVTCVTVIMSLGANFVPMLNVAPVDPKFSSA